MLLSIAGVDRVDGNAHYAGKREQERLVTEGPVPWTIVPATQFHDFAAMMSGWTEQDGVATIPPLLVQPIAPEEVADILAEIATGPPQGRYRRYRRTRTAGPGGHGPAHQRSARPQVKLVPTWSSLLGPEMAGDVLLPGEDARIAPTTFDNWLAEESKATRTAE